MSPFFLLEFGFNNSHLACIPSELQTGLCLRLCIFLLRKPLPCGIFQRQNELHLPNKLAGVGWGQVLVLAPANGRGSKSLSALSPHPFEKSALWLANNGGIIVAIVLMNVQLLYYLIFLHPAFGKILHYLCINCWRSKSL